MTEQLQKEDEVEIDLAANEQPTTEIVVEEPEEGAKKKQALTPEIGIEELKRQLSEESEKRKLAEQLAQKASQELNRARNETEDAQITMVRSGLEKLQERGIQLKNAYANALAEQDFARVAEIQEEISENVLNKKRLEEGLQSMENRPKQKVELDPVEAAARELTPRSAAWIRSHPEYIRDPRLYNKLVAAHNLVVADGVEVDSDDYFSGVESALRIKPQIEQERDQQQEAMSESAKATGGRRSSPPPAAPVSRSAPTGSSRTPTRITLTAQERDIAESMGMTPEEYGRNKLQLQREGKLN